MNNSQLNVKIIRKAKITTYPFTDYFKGFENVEAVRRIFGEKTEEVLRNLRIEFFGRRGYMGVSDEDGHLFISADYLKNGDLVDIYLDIIHELVHVKQFMDGKKLFDDNFSYVERPTEIEAYRVAVDEAKRLGLSDEKILQYLKTEWMSEEDLKKLAKTLHVKYTPTEGKSKRRRL
ncbi:MAG: hypothetical protein QXL57_03835 [Candidatus Bathyarchaeia archaeon]